MFLSWCSSSSESTITTEANGFTFAIPDWFNPLHSSLVENKQITNKVLFAYQANTNEDDAFKDNIVLTLSNIDNKIDYEQFRSINSKKLFTTLVGYTPGTQERTNFDCWDKEIPGYLVTFSLKNTFGETGNKTHIAQFQFVSDKKGYIYSYATTDEGNLKNAKNRLTNISCPSGEEAM